MKSFSLIFLTLLLKTSFSTPILNTSLHQYNPLADLEFYVDTTYEGKVRNSLQRASTQEKQLLAKVLKAPTAVWLSSKSFVLANGLVDKTLAAASAKPKKQLVTFVVYNLPNRDCGAGASAGEFCCSKKNGVCDPFDRSNWCEDGLWEYRNRFIDPLVKSVKNYCGNVPMAFLIEPDAVPNLATSTAADCTNPATRAAYRKGITYAVNKLKEACTYSTIYVDAGHGAWLGWSSGLEKFIEEFRLLGITSKIRGFSINLSNYQELGIVCPAVGTCNDGGTHPCCKQDACGLAKEYNLGFTAVNYVQALRQVAWKKLKFSPSCVIDTSRNGVAASRANCKSWCNVRGAGVGRFPTARTGVTGVDAYMWVKPPGESDGCTKILPNGGRCSRFAPDCESADSIGSKAWEPRAPEGGQWFDLNIKLLAKHGQQNLL